MAKQITIEINELIRALEASTLLIGKDNYIPILAAIHVVKDGPGVALFEATDRYRIGHIKTRATGNVGIDALLSTDFVKDALWALKQARRTTGRLRMKTMATLDFTDDTVALRVGFASQQYVIKGALINGTYPKVGHIASRLLDTQARITKGEARPISQVALNPGYLGSMTKIANMGEPNSPMHVVFSDKQTEPVLITFENWFVGLVMPVRFDATNYVSPRAKGSMFTEDAEALAKIEQEFALVVEEAVKPEVA